MPNFTSPSSEILERNIAVSSALASFGMEGLEPDRETASFLEAYASGSITLEQFGQAVERYVSRLDPQEAA